MVNLKLWFAAAAVALSSSTISAQEQESKAKDYKPYPYVFVGVQGGVQTTFTNYDCTKLITPVGAASFGAYFTPVVGARLHVNGWKNKGGFKDYNGSGADFKYNYNYVTTDLDLLLNLTNLFCKGDEHFFNVILVGGIGLNYAWDNDDLLATQYQTEAPLAWEDHRLSHNARVGLQFDMRLSKHWNVNLEVNANNLSDRYNSKSNVKDDWQANAMVGLTYKFGFRKKEIAPVPVVAEPTPARVVEPAPVVVPAKKVEKKEEASLKENIYFKIASSEIRTSETSKMQKIADFMKQNPNSTITVTGYADKGTGNAKINAKYAKLRADNVKVELIKKYGIAANRITTESKGDTVQPFADNDSNRVVIAVNNK